MRADGGEIQEIGITDSGMEGNVPHAYEADSILSTAAGGVSLYLRESLVPVGPCTSAAKTGLFSRLT